MTARLRLAALVHCAVLVAPLAVEAAPAVIVNDSWLDDTRTDPAAPTYSENGADVDVDNNLESAWYNSGGTMDVNPGHLLTANGAASASWTTYFTPEIPITLANANESLRVTWVFTPSNVNTGNANQDFRIAVVDSGTAPRLAADGIPPNDNPSGYSMFMNMGQTLGNANPFQLRERTGGTQALLSNAGSWVALANGATNGAAGYASGATFTFMMTLTRNDTSGLDISVRMTGGALNNVGFAAINITDATPNNGSFSYDTFAIRTGTAGTTAGAFDTSLFKVEFIPYFLPGDFNEDGLVSQLDYLTLVANLHTNVLALTPQQSYYLGDMTADRKIDGHDFVDFLEAYDDANGLGAFVAMVADVPEPSAGALAALACAGLVARRHPKGGHA